MGVGRNAMYLLRRNVVPRQTQLMYDTNDNYCPTPKHQPMGR
jgi:hypothetical protein